MRQATVRTPRRQP